MPSRLIRHCNKINIFLLVLPLKLFTPVQLKSLIFVLLSFCFFINNLEAQNSIQAIRIETPPLIDGAVNEENTTVLTISDSRYELFIKADTTDSLIQSI